jgi:aquaglyceroporin related protein, other eukaryote
MVAPFFGCLTGGFLYDLFIFTGDSPINRPCFGFSKKDDRPQMDHV